MDLKYRYVGIIGGIFIIMAFADLIFNVHITKETDHLSYKWMLLVFFGQVLLFFYSFVNKLYYSSFTSLIIAIGVLYILYTKMNYE